MGFIRTFFGKLPEEGISKSDLEAFVARRIPENLNLEYTEKEALAKPRNVARKVAAFANSEGGLLVLGTSEKREGAVNLPDRITWDPDPGHSREWVEAVLVHSIHPPLKGVRIIQVRSPEEGVVYLIDVPASSAPPHMSPDGLYYQRNNFSVLPMEHYQVADAFGKRRRPELRPYLVFSGFDATNRSFHLKYGLMNEGRALAKWLLVHIIFAGCDVEQEKGIHIFENLTSQTEEDGLKVWLLNYGGPTEVLHPMMMKPCGSVQVRMTSSLSLLTVLVGAEDSPTERHVAMLGEQWLKARASPNPEQEVSIPIWPAEGTDVEDLRAWQEQFNEDVRATPNEVAGKLIVRFLLAFGTKFMESIAAQATNQAKQPSDE